MQPPSLSPNSNTAADPAADRAACKALLSQGSRTFYAASFLLPQRIRESASSLYAFCRLADDAIDLSADPAKALSDLNERLALAYAGQPLPSAADRAFAEVVARVQMPRALPAALLEGFAWDAAARRYETLEDLTGYAARVAGTVGAMMTVLMGVRDPEALARACDLGVAMQFSNIARDVGEDARAKRLYLPLNWLREAGIDADLWLDNPTFTPALGRVVARLLAHAETLYERAEAGIALLPRSCRPGINAARVLYAEIGREVARAGCDSVTARARVSGSRKIAVLTRALAQSARLRRRAPMEALAACQFLVASIEAGTSGAAPHARAQALGLGTPPWWNLHGRVVWVIDLFERLERLERYAHASEFEAQARRRAPGMASLT